MFIDNLPLIDVSKRILCSSDGNLSHPYLSTEDRSVKLLIIF